VWEGYQSSDDGRDLYRVPGGIAPPAVALEWLTKMRGDLAASRADREDC
jgi:hypothetical protein